MNSKEVIILTENVEMVEYIEDATQFSNTSFTLISDPTQTIEFAGFISEAFVKEPPQYLKNLFGVWLECGDEDELLQDIYRSRLSPSSFPID